MVGDKRAKTSWLSLFTLSILEPGRSPPAFPRRWCSLEFVDSIEDNVCFFGLGRSWANIAIRCFICHKQSKNSNYIVERVQFYDNQSSLCTTLGVAFLCKRDHHIKLA